MSAKKPIEQRDLRRFTGRLGRVLGLRIGERNSLSIGRGAIGQLVALSDAMDFT
jgi:hypothetical protein